MWNIVDARVRTTVDSLTQRAHERPVFRRRDLVGEGIDDTLMMAMVRRGELTRLRHGVYALTSSLEGADASGRHRIELAAAIAGAREPVWAFGPSAALLHGMPLPFTTPNRLALVRPSGADERRLTQPSRHRLTIPDAHVTTGPLDLAGTVIVSGVPCVVPGLAAVSTAAALTSSRWRTALLDAALWRGETSEDLAALIGVWRQLGHRAEVLSALSRARVGAQTVLETFSRLAFVEGGLPEPILQQSFHDENGLIGYVDMWWPDLNVIGEADGLVKYTSRDDVVREKRREDRLRALGPAVVRWTFEDIESRPQSVVAAIRRVGRRAA